ncbi:hypothetical protein V8E53_002374 [Lactarius tabidus]
MAQIPTQKRGKYWPPQPMVNRDAKVGPHNERHWLGRGQQQGRDGGRGEGASMLQNGVLFICPLRRGGEKGYRQQGDLAVYTPFCWGADGAEGGSNGNGKEKERRQQVEMVARWKRRGVGKWTASSQCADAADIAAAASQLQVGTQVDRNGGRAGQGNVRGMRGEGHKME